VAQATPLRPLAQWPLAERQQVRGIFTDIDDTLTTHGSITPDALGALAALQQAGVCVIAITGRPIGWCAAFMQGNTPTGQAPWPVDAMVAENGALAWVRTPLASTASNHSLRKIYQQDAATRQHNQARMQAVAAQVQAQVPQAQRTQDNGGRETDLAFDYNEFAQLSPEDVNQVLAILHSAGMHTSVSSIHVHGCFGEFDKWQGACWIVRQLLGRELAQELAHWVCVGDSGNDQAMFAHFRHSVGVANLRRYAAQLRHLPHYICQAERGAGFAELAQAILQAHPTHNAPTRHPAPAPDRACDTVAQGTP
jgi:HAD superfamily hydrolase (TIGR01484 family)